MTAPNLIDLSATGTLRENTVDAEPQPLGTRVTLTDPDNTSAAPAPPAELA